MEEEEPTGFVCFDKFQPMMAKVMLERRYQPVSEETLLKAFQVLDVDKNSHITPDEMRTYMMQEGEPFQQVKKGFLSVHAVCTLSTKGVKLVSFPYCMRTLLYCACVED